METDFLPPHLRKYVVAQNYEKYTPLDQAVWRFVLRQLRDYLSVHAHECYLEGLEKTGIEVEHIPHIEQISQKLQKFGWRALPVSGFIPPAAFMELQSLGVLPIASDMRTVDHLLYTPAPDIVHEAAGHAPILVHPEFAAYLTQYAQVAKKAIISKEDLNLYEAIRDLSDIKENPQSTPEQIKACEEHLAKVSKSMSHASEATELSRMNWWTAEYGLIGDMKNPKLYGAGLLSSVGEAKLCLSDKVKKIPLSLDCIQMTYDITEPQPQLFVTPDFKTLGVVLQQMADQMAFRQGGLKGLQKALKAQSVNTAQLSSGVQISGKLIEVLTDSNDNVIYLRFEGPSQISYADKQLPGHDKGYHVHGFGTPLGSLKAYPEKCLGSLCTSEWSDLGIEPGKTARLEYVSGVVVTGTVKNILKHDGKNLLLSLTQAQAEYQGRVLFEPSWGTFDIALGKRVTSVFGGAADREAYGDMDDFIARRVPAPHFTPEELKLHQNYATVRKLREDKIHGSQLDEAVKALLPKHRKDFPQDWLLLVEILELLKNHSGNPALAASVEKDLTQMAHDHEKNRNVINQGLRLSGSL